MIVFKHTKSVSVLQFFGSFTHVNSEYVTSQMVIGTILGRIVMTLADHVGRQCLTFCDTRSLFSSKLSNSANSAI